MFHKSFLKYLQQPTFMQKRFSNVLRGNYSILRDIDLSYFEKLLGQNYVLSDSTDTQPYNIDIVRSCKGQSKIVLKPENTKQIAEILKYCNEKKLAICPQGGNTGLVGGSVPVFDEIILSMQRLNKIESVDEITGIMICEAGCILENLSNEATKHGLCFPLDLGAKGTCQIGGNISTNAGGLRVLRYGSLHGSVLGVETVFASGEILNLMSNFKKDNTGYHLKHLFIGSEGTLGVVTKCSILCPPLSKSIHVAFLGLPSYDAVLKTFLNAKKHLGEILSACEFIDEIGLKSSIQTYNLMCPVQKPCPFYMLIETSGSNALHDEEKFESFLNFGMKSGEIIDGSISKDPSKIIEMWKIRELVPMSLISKGFTFNYDISVPLRSFYEIVTAVRNRLPSDLTKTLGYGHLGDSNLHVTIGCSKYDDDIFNKIEPFIYECTEKLNGSISAEHGIGISKKKYLKFSKSSQAINLMTDTKKMLDPNFILNPYKVFENSYLK